MSNAATVITESEIVLAPPVDGWSRLRSFLYSCADQGFSVGGNFLANVVLARSISKEEYGTFVLAYSVFMYVGSIHNSAVLEPFTVFGSGRFAWKYPAYFRLMFNCNLLVGAALSGLLLLVYGLLRVLGSSWATLPLLGLALVIGVLLTASFVRRSFYVRRKPAMAALTSGAFASALCLGLWYATHAKLLNGFSVFVVIAVAWFAAALLVKGSVFPKFDGRHFSAETPGYWHEHWRYSRWALASTFAQLTTQGYYWVVAGLLTVKEVGELRAMYMMVTPVDQVFIALSFLILPRMALHYAQHELSALTKIWRTYAIGAIAATALVGITIRFIGAPVVHLLYAGRFDSVVPILYLLAAMPLLMSVGNSINDALKAVESPKFVFFAYVASGLVTFGIGIPLVKYLGLRGAALGMLLSAATYSTTLAIGFAVTLKKKHRALRALGTAS